MAYRFPLEPALGDVVILRRMTASGYTVTVCPRTSGKRSPAHS